MPDYKTGTHIIRGRLSWPCERCGHVIQSGIRHFARIEEFGDVLVRTDGETYRQKVYHRFHLDCARALPDLNQYETSLIFQEGASQCHT